MLCLVLQHARHGFRVLRPTHYSRKKHMCFLTSHVLGPVTCVMRMDSTGLNNERGTYLVIVSESPTTQR
jgi:hypothetical protein